MAGKKLPNWAKLVEKAVRDPEFRDKLLKHPKAVAESEQITLDKKSVAELKKLAPHLKRFGGRPDVAARDAKSWTVGILSHMQFCVCVDPNEI